MIGIMKHAWGGDCLLVPLESPIDSSQARNCRHCRCGRLSVWAKAVAPYPRKSLRTTSSDRRREFPCLHNLGIYAHAGRSIGDACHAKCSIPKNYACRALSAMRASHRVDSIRKILRPYFSDARRGHVFVRRNRKGIATPGSIDAFSRLFAAQEDDQSAFRLNRLVFPFVGPPFRVVQRPGRCEGVAGRTICSTECIN